jgi:hypothetical protein
VAPLLLVLVGVCALAGGVAILRTFGPRYRVGRLLATTPKVSVDDALAIAQSHSPRYVRVDGRLDSDEDFEDADHRPLVFRRTRIEARRDGRWEPIDDRRERVDFHLNEGLSSIDVDDRQLDAGLVVVPRESVGVASDLAESSLADRIATLPATTAVRLRVEQVSSVEHATILGVPVTDAKSSRMTAGLGRPLVLTTLERDEAMRILTGGRGARLRLAAALMAIGLAAMLVAVAWWLFAAAGVVAAATPEPTQIGGGDPRSAGEGPGLVGAPLVAIGVVIGLGILAALATFLWVRLTGGRPPRN